MQGSQKYLQWQLISNFPYRLIFDHWLQMMMGNGMARERLRDVKIHLFYVSQNYGEEVWIDEKLRKITQASKAAAEDRNVNK